MRAAKSPSSPRWKDESVVGAVAHCVRKHPHPQYNAYLNEKKIMTFKIEFGNIVWGKTGT